MGAGVLTLLALVPLLARLPRVGVVACFDSGHPLYQWVPSTSLTGSAHCVSAPTPVVTWTLMVAATLLVQLVVLPLLLAAGAVLVQGARRLAASADRVLAALLAGLSDLLVPARRPVPVRIRASYTAPLRTRENRRGPPARSC